MTNDVDFDGNVDEVKQQIRDLDNPDYRELLEQEKSGKDRKTVKEFIEKRMDSDEGTEVTEEEVEEELVDEIEEETRGGLLGGVSPEVVLTAGLAGGLVLGLMFGLVFDLSGADTEINAQEAEDRVSTLYEGQFEDFEVADSEVSNGMHLITANVSQEVPAQGNETDENATEIQSFEQNFYMTSDGVLLFPEQQQFGQTIMPLDVEAQLQALQQQEQQQGQEGMNAEDLEEELNSSE